MSRLESIIDGVVETLKRMEGDLPIRYYDASEAGQTEAAKDYLDGYIKYCSGIGWMVFDVLEGRFRDDYGEPALYAALDWLAKRRLATLARKGKKLGAAYAKQAATYTGQRSIESLLRNKGRIFCKVEDFDKDPYLLNCSGVTINLKTGEKRISLPEDMFIKTTACIPEAGGCSLFYKFLFDITCGRKDLAAWILRWFGYCLTGDMSAGYFANAWGGGQNGKSVLLNLMRRLFGSYASTVSSDIVVDSNNNKQKVRNDFWTLIGLRLAILPDVPPGKMAMENIKNITGGDEIIAERKFRDSISFHPTVKLTIASNNRLELRDTGKSMERRIRMIPFEYTVPENEIIPDLADKLFEEGPGVLQLLIGEAKDYLKYPGRTGFPECRIIEEESAAYLESEDFIQQFIDERLEKSQEDMITASTLYGCYKVWNETQGSRPLKLKTFLEKIVAKGFKRKHTNQGNAYLGIRIKG